MHLKSFPKGANAICTYLWSEILSFKTSGHPAASARKLLIQVDNASGENKNKYVFGFLAWLVALGLFDEVEANFLIAGHTHDIIDSLFGELKAFFENQGVAGYAIVTSHLNDYRLRSDSGRLGRHDGAGVSSSCQTQEAAIIAAVYDAIDFKQLLSPHLSQYAGHTGTEGKAKTGGPHAFRFRLYESKDGSFVGMQTRTLASQTEQPWHGDDGNTDEQYAIPVFTSLPPRTGALPLCKAEVHLPSTLADDVVALSKFFDDAASKLPAGCVDTRGQETKAWFTAVLTNKTLACAETAASPGVSRATTLRSAVVGRDAPVRSVCAEAKLVIPSLAELPKVIASPSHAMQCAAQPPAQAQCAGASRLM